MDIIIFGGQSNMQGQSETLSDTKTVPDSYEYKYLTDDIIPLKNPVGEDITFDKKQGYRYDHGVNQNEWLNMHVTGSACYGNTNLVPQFCRAYTQTTGNKALAVHIAKGSTAIEDWLPGSGGYEIIKDKATAAILKADLQNSVKRIFFVWLQGESDAINGNGKNYYKQNILKLCRALKQDINIEKFCIIRVGRFTNDKKDFEIIFAQDEICVENNDFLMLTDIAVKLNDQSEYMNPFVKGHYSAKGLEKLGFEAGKSLGLFVKYK